MARACRPHGGDKPRVERNVASQAMALFVILKPSSWLYRDLRRCVDIIRYDASQAQDQ